MPISLETIREVASAIAGKHGDTLKVMGILVDGEDVDILMAFNDSELEPCRVVRGASRNVPAEELHSAITQCLERHLGSSARRTILPPD